MYKPSVSVQTHTIYIVENTSCGWAVRDLTSCQVEFLNYIFVWESHADAAVSR